MKELTGFYYLQPNRHYFSCRDIFLIIIGSFTAIFNFLLMLLILVHKHRFWTSYKNYMLSMLISSSCFVIVGFSLEVNIIDGQTTDPRTMDTFLCKTWYFFTGSILDGSILSLVLIHIDRVVSLFSPQKYTTISYEKSSKLALSMTWALIIVVNLSLAFGFGEYDQFLPTRPCIHLMHYRKGQLSLMWGCGHFIAAVLLVVAVALKTKAFPPNEIENKVNGCVLAILLLDFFLAFLRFAPVVARQVLGLSDNFQETKELLELVEWSSQMLPPLFWLLDSNIRKSIKIIFCCTRQRKSVDLVEKS